MTEQEYKNLKIGDEVIYIGEKYLFGPLCNWKGIIKRKLENNTTVLIKWDHSFECGKPLEEDPTGLLCAYYHRRADIPYLKLVKKQLEFKF